MASLVLTAVSASAATAGSASFASMLAPQLASMAVNYAAGAALSKPAKRHMEGARLEDLAVQTSTYGRSIAHVYGTARIAGNVIWAMPIREIATTSTVRSSGGKGGSRRRTQTVSQTNYSYTVTLAIAICEGPITRLERVWADAKQLDVSQGTFRFYHGSESQLPDTVIEAVEGLGRAPAYRGLSYVVIEDFPLGDFGNRIPNFSFEVTRQLAQPESQTAPLEERIRSIILLPGSGEYVLDPTIQTKIDGAEIGGVWQQQGFQKTINRNTLSGKADVLVALDQMQQSLPNLEWVGIVVNWFGTSMDMAQCEFYPAVEYRTSTVVSPNPWQVAGYTRDNAYLMSVENNTLRYGGTPDDGSLLRLIQELKARGYKVFLYPMPLMDVPNKPWRGHLTGTAGHVGNFFSRSNGYRRFILHYAALVGNSVDAFAIGSEMRGITSIHAGGGNFPAVTELVSLAGAVKALVGAACKVTYAADWSEYHHTDGGWYHLDPLWASPHIDVVGIDAYFPLTNKAQPEITTQDIRDGWQSGEGYDWFYTDVARTQTQPLAPAYAWKNIDWWWKNPHINPNSQVTPWVPQSKPIWFTEFGFASVDGTTNQPNVFVDPSSSENFLPRFSRGRVDFPAQRMGIAATEAMWENSPMVSRRFLWAWDARPYPAWPDLRDVWADGANWVTGHWVQGKLGKTYLAGIVAHLLRQTGLPTSSIDVSALTHIVDGFVVPQRTTLRALLEQLQLAYGFELRESAGILYAILRGKGSVRTLSVDTMLPLQTQDGKSTSLLIEREESSNLPARLEVRYLDRLQDYGTSIQSAMRHDTIARDTEQISLSLVLSETVAQTLAEQWLYSRWIARTRFQFQLPIAHADLEVGDSVVLQSPSVSEQVCIQKIHVGRPGVLRIEAVSEQSQQYDYYLPPRNAASTAPKRLAHTIGRLLDLPSMPNSIDDTPRFTLAAIGDASSWPGAVFLRENPANGEPEILASVNQAATMGSALQVLAAGPTTHWDEKSTLEILLMGDGSIESATRLAVLNGANAALVGDEVIQFAQATALGNGRYRIAGLLRGRLGTEAATTTHRVGERFVLLDATLMELPMSIEEVGFTRRYKAVTYGQTESEVSGFDASFSARSLVPLSPVHLRAMRLTSGDVQLSWVRRARIHAGWRDLVDVPLDEANEQYQLQIVQGTTLRRTVSVNSPEWLYTAAQQTSDFGALPNGFTLRVAQISPRVGLGYAQEQPFIFS